jgi:hypothetical protein
VIIKIILKEGGFFMKHETQVSILTAEKFAETVGLPVGVVEAQLDRRALPVLKIGKRRFVNMEALRQRALSEDYDKVKRRA